ncbi:UNKNOWN [Stylonychia lemnae]|uniref:Uncharacterized protein n=1 Tax=Stylonychia lemnae TaxID=5949 RepID=A0A078AWD2_STYLE|nr:UNKNOWN [Stylonychia lemnae]|eukprot:CDW85113.1 UNKNOWN [Stylonychia lemnae]
MGNSCACLNNNETQPSRRKSNMSRKSGHLKRTSHAQFQNEMNFEKEINTYQSQTISKRPSEIQTDQNSNSNHNSHQNKQKQGHDSNDILLKKQTFESDNSVKLTLNDQKHQQSIVVAQNIKESSLNTIIKDDNQNLHKQSQNELENDSQRQTHFESNQKNQNASIDSINKYDNKSKIIEDRIDFKSLTQIELNQNHQGENQIHETSNNQLDEKIYEKNKSIIEQQQQESRNKLQDSLIFEEPDNLLQNEQKQDSLHNNSFCRDLNLIKKQEDMSNDKSEDLKFSQTSNHYLGNAGYMRESYDRLASQFDLDGYHMDYKNQFSRQEGGHCDLEDLVNDLDSNKDNNLDDVNDEQYETQQDQEDILNQNVEIDPNEDLEDDLDEENKDIIDDNILSKNQPIKRNRDQNRDNIIIDDTSDIQDNDDDNSAVIDGQSYKSGNTTNIQAFQTSEHNSSFYSQTSSVQVMRLDQNSSYASSQMTQVIRRRANQGESDTGSEMNNTLTSIKHQDTDVNNRTNTSIVSFTSNGSAAMSQASLRSKNSQKRGAKNLFTNQFYKDLKKGDQPEQDKNVIYDENDENDVEEEEEDMLKKMKRMQKQSRPSNANGAAQMKELKGYNSDEERGTGSSKNRMTTEASEKDVQNQDNSAGLMFKSRSSIHQKQSFIKQDIPISQE